MSAERAPGGDDPDLHRVADRDRAGGAGDVHHLPAGVEDGSARIRLPGHAVLVHVVEAREERRALRHVPDLDVVVGLLRVGVPWALQHRGDDEADMDQTVRGIDVGGGRRHLLEQGVDVLGGARLVDDRRVRAVLLIPQCGRGGHARRDLRLGRRAGAREAPGRPSAGQAQIGDARRRVGDARVRVGDDGPAGEITALEAAVGVEGDRGAVSGAIHRAGRRFLRALRARRHDCGDRGCGDLAHRDLCTPVAARPSRSVGWSTRVACERALGQNYRRKTYVYVRRATCGSGGGPQPRESEPAVAEECQPTFRSHPKPFVGAQKCVDPVIRQGHGPTSAASDRRDRGVLRSIDQDLRRFDGCTRGGSSSCLV